MKIFDLLNKLEKKEASFLNTQFLAPVLPNGKIRIRIAGVVCTLNAVSNFELGNKTSNNELESNHKTSWAILEPVSMDKAKIIGKPSLKQIQDYLNLFPKIRLILISRKKHKEWLAIKAHKGDSRFNIKKTVSVQLVNNTDMFQQIIARFDGQIFWFQEIDRKRNPAIADYLKKSLGSEKKPDEINKSSLTPEEREAYDLLYQAVQESKRDKVEIHLAEVLAHAGAEFISYIERDDNYTVEFVFDGFKHHSIVSKTDLTVISAGICLSGEDRKFDLQSLVGVLRESGEHYY